MAGQLVTETVHPGVDLLVHVPTNCSSAQTGSANRFRCAAAAFTMAFTALFATAAYGQGGVSSGQGQMSPGQRVPFIAQPEPPALTSEQELLREQAMERANQPGPPLPVGPLSTAPYVPETPAGTNAELSAPGTEPGAPGTLRYFERTGHGPYATGTSSISETHAGTAGRVVFMAGNWFGSYSTDGGESFNFVNPYTQFPALDGGFCCDQTVIYDHTRDQMIWQLQYSYSAGTQRGSYRIAFADASSVATGGWCYYDFSPASFGLGAGLWLDYPHVALSDNFVWYTVNVYNTATPAAWQRTIIFRIPLDPVTTCGGFAYNYLVVSDRFNFTPTQGASTTMYWASHNTTSSVRVYRWAENSGTIFWDDVGISTWPRTLPYQCPGPDGLNWCGRGPNDGRIQTGWVSAGVIGFMWNAGQGTNRPFPYVHVARFNESNRALINEPIIWNSSYAWAFPAIGVNDRGHLAGSVYFGGGSYYPTMQAFIWDDFSSAPAPWEVYFVVASAQGANNAWGDWYSSRRHGVIGNTWITTGQQRLASGNVRAWYLWFGRERDAPPAGNDFLAGYNSGTWEYLNHSFWNKITSAVPNVVGAGDLDGNLQDEAVASYGSGTWVHYNHSFWGKVTSATASAVAIGDLDGSGRDEVIGAYGTGTWARYNNSIWKKLTSAVASELATGDLDGNGLGELIASFGNGTWVLYNNATWTKLHNASPSHIATGDLDGSGRDELIVDFGGAGLWARYNNATWTKLHNASPSQIATGDLDGSGKDDLICAFGNGTWVLYNNATWAKPTSAIASQLAAGDLDGNGQEDLIASFGSGTWVRYNNAIWAKPTSAIAKGLADGGFD